VSLVHGAIIGASVSTEDPGSVGAAIALLSFVVFVQMLPATVGVIYLWMKLRSRSAPRIQQPVSERLPAA
jgi:hypothetical protein